MNNTIYFHNGSNSVLARLIISFLRIYGMHKRMKRKILKDKYRKYPAKIPGSIRNNFHVSKTDLSGRKTWTFSNSSKISNTFIIYIHGGAYYSNIIRFQWNFVKKLLHKTNAKIIVPDYPLAPEHNVEEVYSFMETLYRKIIQEHENQRIVLIGDSAGGGLALGFAQFLRDKNLKQPSDLILLSPWLDLTMINPIVSNYAKSDKILNINALKIAAKKYSGNISTKDYRVSPVFGSFYGLGRISLFTSTNDILYADAQKLKFSLDHDKTPFNYYEYKNLFHDWPLITFLKESAHVTEKIQEILMIK
ncbi:MAG: alpha/beta hydrolase [Marinilabiliales bacterium]|nr:MAG: alpha/beta hydrolase [Marinilabiliales bacterium]